MLLTGVESRLNEKMSVTFGHARKQVILQKKGPLYQPYPTTMGKHCCIYIIQASI